MASPYTIRSRNQILSPIPNGNLFKTFDTSPRPISRRLNTFDTNKYQKMTAGKNNNQLTPPFNKSKPETLKKKTSLPQFSNNDLYSNSYNESSLLPEKYKRNNIDFQRTQQNIRSSQNTHSLVLCNNQGERQMQHNDEKKSIDEIDLKDSKKVKKLKNWSCYGVPYRKCHSFMQEKVVSVINKIKNGKDCHKEIQTLIQKSKKVSIKELNNRYFVSGIQLISNLALQKQHKNVFNSELIIKLTQGLQQLKTRILSQLDNIKGFQTKSLQPQQISFEKLQLVRRAYKVLRKKLKNQKRQQVQNKALNAADWFIQNKINNLYLFYEQLAQR